MSTIANWAYTNDLTFWSATFDAYGQPTYTVEYVLKGAYKRDTTLGADGGVPGQIKGGLDVFYFEYSGLNPPRIGWRVALGSHAGQPPSDAKEIAGVTEYDVRMFGETVPDYQVSAR